jgi:glycosyltransferase involved in cell wall biosynthesis
METLAAGVWRTLSTAAPGARLIAFGGRNRGLVYWLPYALWKVARQTATRRSDVVLCGDALMYTVLAPVLWVTRTPSAAMVIGLDVTYKNPLYRSIVHRFLSRAPLLLAISDATAQAIPSSTAHGGRVRTLRLGVSIPDVQTVDRAAARAQLCSRFGLPDDSILLVTLGRLVRRKGARWFVDQVLPGLPGRMHYVVAGTGDETSAIEAAARARRLADRVHLIGGVDDHDRELLLTGADVFVQPNIAVPGDIEGFGLVTVEAAVRGTPVVAAALEGLLDAVVDGETGILLPPGDAESWTTRLIELTSDPQSLRTVGAHMRDAARARYDEREMGRQLIAYLDLLPRRG